MPLLDNPHLYIVGLSWLAIAIFVVFILYYRRERKKILKILDDVNRSTSKKDQAISEKLAELAAAYENILKINQRLEKINQRLEEEVHLRADNLTNQHAKALEHVRFYSHKLRGTLASMMGLLQLAQTEEMSQSLKELLEMMNTCTRRMDQILHEFTRQLEDDI